MGSIEDILPSGRGKFILLGFIVLLIGLVLFDPSCLKVKNKKPIPAAQTAPHKASEPSKNLTGQIRRVSHVERGGDFIEDLFFRGDNEVARQKIEKGVVVDHQGQNINGTVKFFNELDQTYGEVKYFKNLRHGLSTTYFPDGKVILEEHYREGKIVSSKEFYPVGSVRFESDYSEALNCPTEKEVGVARLYYPSGKIKYEWNLTWRKKGGFKKTYNTDGSLRYVAWFNDKCQKIKEEYPPVKSQ